ncbi:MAG: hypothetical protein M9921_08810 [Fimbriimonadaceae bacterium]|nr:hypothetical protein [Chthonomonadaceae bacterium]MCO5296944.1 hypothetical protein [Fimbriimonadaceae bacterium]
MELSEAKAYEGQHLSLTWRNRKGDEVTQVVDVVQVAFVPMYGPCFVTDAGNIALDRVVSLTPQAPLRRAA